MPTRRAFMALLVVACVVLSALADRGATQHVVTGTVAEFEAGEWLSVANEQALRLRLALRKSTAYEWQNQGVAFGPAGIKPGTPVTVWYRSTGDRIRIADKVRVLPIASTR